MNISKARKRLRIFLLATLCASMCFFATAAYYTYALKTKSIKIETITPTLYAIDIIAHQTKASLSDDDGKHSIAKSLYYKGLYDDSYFFAGFEMMTKLADNGHAPSQLFQGNVLAARPVLDIDEKATHYLTTAAKNGYIPARERLQELLKTTEYKVAKQH